MAKSIMIENEELHLNFKLLCVKKDKKIGHYIEELMQKEVIYNEQFRGYSTENNQTEDT